MSLRISRPLQAEAFELAMRELARRHPEAANKPYVVDALIDALLDMAAAGETVAEALARRGLEAGLAAYRLQEAGE